MSTIQATGSKVVMSFNHSERYYAKSMASEFGVSIKALYKDASINDKRIDFVKRCTVKKKIVSCDLDYATVLRIFYNVLYCI